MNALFIFLRLSTGVTSLCAFALLGFVVFLRGAASTARRGVQVFAYVTRLFASAFTEGTAPAEASWRISPWQVMIGALSLMMLISVFTPGSRWFLHGTALLAAIVMIGYLGMIFSGASLEVVCLPFLVVWFGYYAMWAFWFQNFATR